MKFPDENHRRGGESKHVMLQPKFLLEIEASQGDSDAFEAIQSYISKVICQHFIDNIRAIDNIFFEMSSW